MFIAEFLTVAFVHFLAVASPGPDFAVVTRNSLLFSRRAGIATAVGIALGISVHVAYSLLGIAVVISQSIILFNVIKYLGAGYLLYIGYKALRARPATVSSSPVAEKEERSMSDIAAFRVGFITNVLNPKATLFFLSVFTQVIDSTTPAFIQFLYGLEMMIATFLWFGFLSLVFSNEYLKAKILGVQHYVERFMGTVLIALGLKIAFTSK